MQKKEEKEKTVAAQRLEKEKEKMQKKEEKETTVRPPACVLQPHAPPLAAAAPAG